MEEDKEEVSGELSRDENHAYENVIEKWFQANTRLDQFHFCFYLVKSQIKQLVLHILVYFHFLFEKLKMNIFSLLLCEWLHWKYAYT